MVNLKSLILCALSVLPLVSAARLNQLPVDPEVRMGTLPDGLHYYIRHNDNPTGQADFFIAMSVGSVNEEESQRGLAHFLEHMCFNGTKHFPGNSLIDYLESVGVKFGANLNAYTSTDETVYNICQVPVQRESTVDSCLLILRDWSHDLTLDSKEIDKERGVIVGEWRQRMASANARIMERVMPELYSGTIYGNRMPIGLMSVVENFKPKTLRKYYEKWYHPYNQCIIVVGDVDVDRTQAEIERLWADVKAPKGASRFELPAVPDNASPFAVVGTDPEQTGTTVQMYIKHDGLADGDVNTINELRQAAVADIAASILAERLTDVENEDNSPIRSTAVGDTKFFMSRGQKAFTLRSPVTRGRAADAVKVFASELKRAAAQGVSQTEFERAKIDMNASVRKRYSNRTTLTNTDYARKYVRHFLDGGALPSEEQWWKMMRGVVGQITIDEVDNYLKSLVREGDAGVVIVAYMPADDVTATTGDDLVKVYTSVDGAALPAYVDAAVSGSILETEPVAGKVVATDSLALFGAEVLTLSNGIKVYTRFSADKPEQIFVQGYSPGGFSQDYRPDEYYIYTTLNDILARGRFGKYTNDQLRRLLVGEDVSCKVSVENMEEVAGVSTSPTSLDKAMQVLYLKSTSAAKDEQALRNYIDQARTNLTTRQSNPTFAMGDSIHAIVYNHHPFGAKIDLAGLDRIDYDRIMDIYHDRFGDMGDFTFFVTGNFDRDSLIDVVERYIASLPSAGRMETAKDCGYGYFQGRDSRRFEMPMETPQSIAYTFYNSPSEYNLTNVIRGHILGQIIQNKLRKTLREERGWTYSIRTHVGIGAGLNGNDPANAIMPVYIKVSPENAAATFEFVDTTVRSMADPSVISDDELAAVKQYMAKNYADNINDNAYWITVLHMYDKFGQDMHSDYLKILDNTTAADLSDFARRYLIDANRVQLEMAPAAK